MSIFKFPDRENVYYTLSNGKVSFQCESACGFFKYSDTENALFITLAMEKFLSRVNSHVYF